MSLESPEMELLPPRTKELMNEVFSDENLRERILKFVVENDRLNNQDIRSCRLVHSSWRASVTNCLQKLNKSLFSVWLPPFNQKKSVKQFDIFVANLLERQESFPSIAVKIRGEYFEDATFQSVINRLTRLGTGLLSLYLDIPAKGSYGRVASADLNLSVLRELKVSLNWTSDSDTDDDDYDDTILRENADTTSFLQLILSRCTKLEHFRLYNSKSMTGLTGYKNLQLPATLAHLELINLRVNMRHLRRLLGSPLPQLKKLTLSFAFDNLASRLDLGFLDNVRNTVRTLELNNYRSYCPINEINVELPRMESLENLDVYGYTVEGLHGEKQIDLGERLPALKKLKLITERLATLRSWIAGCFYGSVEDVDLKLESRDHPPLHGPLEEDEDQLHSVLNSASLLHPAFPNVVKLDLEFDLSAEISGLEHVFRNFQQLRHFHFKVWRSRSNYERKETTLPAANWISLFLGISKEMGSTLASKNSFLKYTTSNLTPSIAYMTGLQTLCVNANSCCVKPTPLDAVFYFGFMNMPRLGNISFYGNFQVSSKTANRWKKAGTGRVLNINIV